MVVRELDHEGGYRSNVTVRSLLECARCGVAAVSGANIEYDPRLPPTPLRRTPLVRDRAPAPQPCLGCAAQLLSLRLEWHTREVVIESCERCDTLFLDRGELDAIRAMLAASAPLRTTDLARRAPHTPLDDDDVAALKPPWSRWLHRLGLRDDGGDASDG
jgi:Zn-finger nucleic acid-binding protein